MLLEIGFDKMSSKNIKQKTSCFFKSQNLFCTSAFFLSLCFLLHGESFEYADRDYALSQIVYEESDDENNGIGFLGCGSTCKRPKQGPPGPPAPPLGNYLDAFHFGPPQLVTTPNVPIPIVFNQIQLSDGWVVTGGTDFTNAQSGLYLINFGAGIFSGSVFNSNSVLTCFKNGFEYNPAHIYQEYSVYTVSQMTTSCILRYNAGDLLQFTFQCSDTSMSLFGNAFVTITRIE